MEPKIIWVRKSGQGPYKTDGLFVSGKDLESPGLIHFLYTSLDPDG